MATATQVLLIGGCSHAGKSTLARSLADILSWTCISTDSLARHPGRPWSVAPAIVPPHVVEHYRDFDLDQLVASVLAHYKSMWPTLVAPLIAKALGDRDDVPKGMVLEGSALLPAEVSGVLGERVRGLWIVASDALIESRMKAESGYVHRDNAQRMLIDKFLARAIAFNAFIKAETTRLNLAVVELDEEVSEDWPLHICTKLIG